jgi:hypothetical protein
MSAMRAWTVTVLFLIGAVFVLHHLGVEIGPEIGTTLKGLERLLIRPI